MISENVFIITNSYFKRWYYVNMLLIYQCFSYAKGGCYINQKWINKKRQE